MVTAYLVGLLVLPPDERWLALAALCTVAVVLLAVARFLSRPPRFVGTGLIPREDWTLAQASAYGDAARIAELIGTGVSAEELTVALHTAITNLSPEGVRCLLDAGADVNGPIGRGPTPLLRAIEEEADDAREAGRNEAEPEITAILIERGADVNQSANGNAESPIHAARRLGHAKAADLLLRRGGIP